MNQPVNYDQFNSDVKSWSKATKQDFGKEMASLRIDNVSEILRRITETVSKDSAGVANAIKFKFQKHLVFVHKGARRGHGGTKGSTWINAKGERVSTNPNSLGKMNTGRSKAKEWYNPVIERRIQLLADIAAKNLAEINAQKILIK